MFGAIELSLLKVVSATFFQVCFVCLKENTLETRKNVFYFTLKCLSIKHEKHFTEYFGKQTQSGNGIWTVYVASQKKIFNQKIFLKIWPGSKF